MSEIYINGDFFPEEEARVSVFDRGFLYGDGVFETMRAYNGTIFRLEDHMKRLEAAAGIMSIPIDLKTIELALHETLSRNQLNDAILRLTITRGQGSWGLDFPADINPTMVVLARPFTGYPGQEDGINIVIADTRKTANDSLNSSLKSLNFLNNIFARREASSQGFKEAVMLNKDGFVAEGSVSNIFWVSENILYTPALDVGILPGVTRKVVLELADKESIPYEEGYYKPETLLSANEVFLTNTGYEIMPVNKINDTSFPSTSPLTTQLIDKYNHLVREEMNDGNY